MKTAFFIAVYLAGAVIAYLMVKRLILNGYLKEKDRTWTVGDRRLALGIALGSWVLPLIVLWYKSTENDEEAAW